MRRRPYGEKAPNGKPKGCTDKKKSKKKNNNTRGLHGHSQSSPEQNLGGNVDHAKKREPPTPLPIHGSVSSSWAATALLKEDPGQRVWEAKAAAKVKAAADAKADAKAKAKAKAKVVEDKAVDAVAAEVVAEVAAKVKAGGSGTAGPSRIGGRATGAQPAAGGRTAEAGFQADAEHAARLRMQAPGRSASARELSDRERLNAVLLMMATLIVSGCLRTASDGLGLVVESLDLHFLASGEDPFSKALRDTLIHFLAAAEGLLSQVQGRKHLISVDCTRNHSLCVCRRAPLFVELHNHPQCTHS
jgi:hypothetical protein